MGDKKGYLTRKDNQSIQVPFLFNPKEFSVEKSNQYRRSHHPGPLCFDLSVCPGELTHDHPGPLL